MPPYPVFISAAVEGLVDAAVATRLIQYVGGEVNAIHGQKGKSELLRDLRGYNHAARHFPWLVLVDLDCDCHCAPPCLQRWLHRASAQMCFRIATREIETWLLADRMGIASFLSVPMNRVPMQPETLPDPTASMVDLARRSASRNVREDMVPRPGSGRATGPGYVTRLGQFASTVWRPGTAAAVSDSLRRCLCCLRRLVNLSRSTSPSQSSASN